MNLTSKITKFCVFCFGVLLVATNAFGQLNLVGNKAETLIDDPDQSARLMQLVEKAFTDSPINISATTQAWSGTGLLSGTYDGYIDHYTLNNERLPYLFSNEYATLNLHIVSRSPKAVNVVRFDQLTDQRIGIEKRFANTDRLRSVRSVKWARRDSFVENIMQLEERRVDFIVADKTMIEEFNKLLRSINKDPLYISTSPVLTVGVKLAIHTRNQNAEAYIEEFNAGIESLKSSPEYDAIFQPPETQESSLNEALYSEVLRKW